MRAGRTLRSRFLGSTALLPALLLATGAEAQIAPNAAPVGGHVVAGSAAITQNATQTQITQSTDRAAINWQQFNIGRNQHVNFQQPSASSWTLNRVTGPDPSVIAGRLTANGGVAVVNQSGMVFAQGAEVNVASLIASAPNITNANFMAGRMTFDIAANAGARIENRGRITVAQRGLAALVAPEVANKGVIQARMARVALAGAETYALDLAGDGLLSIDVTQSVQHNPNGATALVTNSGTISAEGGSVLLTADAASGLLETLVANTGRISAKTIPVSAGQAERPGVVSLQAHGGGVTVDGRIAATGGAGASGGTIQVNADTAVTLTAARLNASGGTGGGRVFVGTSGVGRDQHMAARTTVAQGVVIRADARQRGNGGTVSINSSGNTTFAGLISARGGPQAGDGGFVETSGQGALTLAGNVDVSARAAGGQTGTLLLDPQNIVVAGRQNTTSNPVESGNGTVLAASAPTNGTLTIGNDQIQNFNGTVRLEATQNITVSADIGKSNGELQLHAQTGLVTIAARVGTTSNLAITGGMIAVQPGAALYALRTISLQSTSGAITVGSNATISAGVSFDATSKTDFVNSGTIGAGNTQSVAGFQGSGTTSNAIYVVTGGDISNTGIIAGTGGGLVIPTGTAEAVFMQATGMISNDGTIQAFARPDGTGGNLRLDTAGLNNNAPINGGSISNTGNLIADGQARLSANTSITNDGVINGGTIASGRDSNAITLSANTTITNTGSLSGYGGGQLTNGGANSISAISVTTANGEIYNGGSMQSFPVGSYYGSVSLTAGNSGGSASTQGPGNVINAGQLTAARNVLLNGGYIESEGSIVAQTGRVEMVAAGRTFVPASNEAIVLEGGTVVAQGTTGPNPAPTNAGRILLSAAQGDVSLLGSVKLTAQTDILISAGSGGVRFDGASLTAPGTVSVSATRELGGGSEAGSIRFDSVNIKASNLVGYVAPGGTGIDLDGATFTIGNAVLLSAPGGITDNDGSLTTIAPLVGGQYPAVIFDARANGLSAIPSGVAPDAAGQSPGAQPTQLGVFGNATSNAAGSVAGLQLDAGSSPVFLLLDGGSSSGFLKTGRLAVLGLGGSADLSGSLNGSMDSGAASFASVSPQASTTATQAYQFNLCVFASVSCTLAVSTSPSPSSPIIEVTPPEVSLTATGTATGTLSISQVLQTVPVNLPDVLTDIAAAVNAASSLRSLLVPQPEIVRFRPLRGRLADPDVLLPNVVDQDY